MRDPTPSPVAGSFFRICFLSPSFLLIVWTVPLLCASALTHVSREPDGVSITRGMSTMRMAEDEHGRQK